MLWSIRDKMKPALSVIEMIPEVHRTQALTVLRRAVIEGRAGKLRLNADEREYAFYDGSVQLTSPIGARALKALYEDGRIKLKKPGPKTLPKLEAYIATEAAFWAHIEKVMTEEAAKQSRLMEIIADPTVATREELTVHLVDKVITSKLGYGAYGAMEIGGVMCHKELSSPDPDLSERMRAEGRVLCWWLDENGQRQGDAE